MPLISVVTTVWNPGRYLEETIQSILNQTFTDFEFILVDDGSTDSSPDLLRTYMARDARVRPFIGERRGAVGAANFGISQATGKYLARIDHDDVAYPHRFAAQVKFLESHPEHVLLGTAYEVISGDGTLLPHSKPLYTEDSQLRARLPFECPFSHSSSMMRLDALRACGGYRRAFDTADDYDLWVRLVPGVGYVIDNKARVALERALSSPRERAMGVDRESKLIFGFSPHRTRN